MKFTADIWQFILALAAVINGLGVIRILNALAEYTRKRESLDLRHYPVYTMLVLFQLLVHLLFWWSAIGLREAGDIDFNFFMYLYLMTGPTLLYLATSVVLPEFDEESKDLRSLYYGFHKTYYTILALFMVWAIFLWPAFGFPFSPNVPLLVATLIIALILRVTVNPKIHMVLMITNLSIYALIIVFFAMKAGGIARMIV